MVLILFEKLSSSSYVLAGSRLEFFDGQYLMRGLEESFGVTMTSEE